VTKLTITVEDEVLRRARLRAAERKTSVDSILRAYLTAYAAEGQTWEQVVDTILRLSLGASSGGGDSRWTRGELHER
jgi:uncharacterized NAD(P)/FAD-binding protein YdhS